MGNDAAALYHRAEQLMAEGRHSAASDAWRRLLLLEPRHPVAWLRLSLLASLAGHPRAAAAAALEAAAADPADRLLRGDICERLGATGESRAAHELLDRTATRGANGSELFDLALLAQRLDQPDGALAFADAAWAAGLRSVPLHYLRATLLVFCGRVDEAERLLEDCLRLAPALAGAHWTLSGLRTWSPAHHHIDRLRRALATANAEAVPYLQFALFKELDDCGDTGAAWTALMAGCAARRGQLHYDPAAEAERFRRLAEVSTPAFLARQAAPTDGPMPIFIVGMPRTGTTLLERLLAGHDQVRPGGELHDFPHQLLWAFDRSSREPPDLAMLQQADTIDYTELGRRYLDRTRWRADGRERYTDKLPRNFALAGFIHRALPGARILHLVRDPMDTCFSNLKQLFGAPYPHSYAMADMATHFRHYRALMAHWHAAMPGAILDVSYEALVADPEAVAREVLAFCGLPWQPGCIVAGARAGAVSTASTVQVREPIHARNVGGWRRYAGPLEPLRLALGEAAQPRPWM
jgi:tetratricopeptide (TPR) repeat protein